MEGKEKGLASFVYPDGKQYWKGSNNSNTKKKDLETVVPTVKPGIITVPLFFLPPAFYRLVFLVVIAHTPQTSNVYLFTYADMYMYMLILNTREALRLSTVFHTLCKEWKKKIIWETSSARKCL